MTEPAVAQQLADWAASAEPLTDAAAVVIARDAFADTIACMFGGMRDPSVQSLIRAASGWNGEGTSCCFGTARQFSLPLAALINGTAAHALDFDDNFIPAFTHCSAVMVPALLAVGEDKRCSGRRLLGAYIIGAELHTRIGLLVNPGHFNRGWHSTATVGTMGTAGACAYLLGLDAGGICTAMSIAFSMAAGSKVQFGSMMKPTHAGLAAQHAVMAACMAAAGTSARPGFLTGSQGFQDLYAENDPKREILALDGLGKKLCLPLYGLLVKRFPCCGSAHKSLDGLLTLREMHDIDPTRIKAATSWLPETMSRNLKFDCPENDMEARFSLQYTAARLLLEGALSLQHFKPDVIRDPTVTDFLPRIHRQTIPDPPELKLDTPLRSRIEMADGSIYETAVTHLKGSLQNPLTADDLQHKLRDCLQFGGFAQLPDKISDEIAAVDTCGDISQLLLELSARMPENL